MAGFPFRMFPRQSQIRLGKPQGIADWALVVCAAIALFGAGSLRRRVALPFFGLFGELPLGMPRWAWLGIAVALWAAYVTLQRSRGNFTIEDVDEDKTITLGLSDAVPQDPAEREKAR